MKTTVTETKTSPKAPYQAPRIETVMRAKDIERELFYAGTPVSTPT